MINQLVQGMAAMPFWSKIALLLPHFTFRLIIRLFLVRFRYTGTIISSAVTVLEAYSSASASAESLTDVLFLPIGTISLLSDHFLLDYHSSHQQRFLIEALSTQLLSARLQLLKRPSVALCHKLAKGGHVCFWEDEIIEIYIFFGKDNLNIRTTKLKYYLS